MQTYYASIFNGGLEYFTSDKSDFEAFIERELQVMNDSNGPMAIDDNVGHAEHSRYLDDLFPEDVSLSLPTPPSYSSLSVPSVEEEMSAHSQLSFKLIGDNIDKNVKPRHMCINHRTKSLHYFNVFAVQDRVSSFDLYIRESSIFTVFTHT